MLLTAFRHLFTRDLFDENLLMTLATFGAWAVGESAEAAAVMLFFHIGEYFQALAVERSRRSIAELMDIRPDFANLLKDGTVSVVAPEAVEPGDRILVRPGERVPLDGVVRSGSSQLDTAALTGESKPRRINAGDAVLSGTINLSGVLEIEVTARSADSTVSRILAEVENAANRKSKSENFITRFARIYTPGGFRRGDSARRASAASRRCGVGCLDLPRAGLSRDLLPVRAGDLGAAFVLRRNRRGVAPRHPVQRRQLPRDAGRRQSDCVR